MKLNDFIEGLKYFLTNQFYILSLGGDGFALAMSRLESSSF